MKPVKPERSRKQTLRKRGDRIDGITSMYGTVTFGSGGVSISVAVTAGSKENTSGFLAAGVVGDAISANTTFQSASWSKKTDGSDVLTASGLSAATVGSNYTVAVRYTLSGSDNSVVKTIAGTIAGRYVTATGSTSVTLS